MTPTKKTTEEEGAVAAGAKVAAVKPRVVRKARALKTAEADVKTVGAVDPALSPASATVMAEKLEIVSAKPAAHLKKFYYAVGRRKSAICQVKMMPTKGEMTVNKIEFTKYFPTIELQAEALSPLVATNQANSVSFMAKIVGGGKRGQSDSLRHALARALVEMDPAYRLVIKKLGYLTRDPRVKERKKPGLKRARRAPQWQKR